MRTPEVTDRVRGAWTDLRARLVEWMETAFSAFYERCPVQRADGGVRRSRLAFCDLTARVLAQGLDVLGIVAPDRM